jgi:hypothetical protein
MTADHRPDDSMFTGQTRQRFGSVEPLYVRDAERRVQENREEVRRFTAEAERQREQGHTEQNPIVQQEAVEDEEQAQLQEEEEAHGNSYDAIYGQSHSIPPAPTSAIVSPEQLAMMTPEHRAWIADCEQQMAGDQWIDNKYGPLASPEIPSDDELRYHNTALGSDNSIHHEVSLDGTDGFEISPSQQQEFPSYLSAGEDSDGGESGPFEFQGPYDPNLDAGRALPVSQFRSFTEQQAAAPAVQSEEFLDPAILEIQRSMTQAGAAIKPGHTDMVSLNNGLEDYEIKMLATLKAYNAQNPSAEQGFPDATGSLQDQVQSTNFGHPLQPSWQSQSFEDGQAQVQGQVQNTYTGYPMLPSSQLYIHSPGQASVAVEPPLPTLLPDVEMESADGFHPIPADTEMNPREDVPSSDHGTQVVASGLSQDALYQYQQHRAAYQSSFPRGATRILTPSIDLHCGLYALIASISAQAPWVPVPTIRQLLDLLDGEHFQDFLRDANVASLRNRSNFSSDQLGDLVWQWGQSQTSGNFNLRLGVDDRGRPPSLVSAEDGVDHTLIWIYNDRVSRESYQFNNGDGLEVVELIGHWEGLRRFDTQVPLPILSIQALLHLLMW